ncbi:hypothetical protein FUA23_04050 [Neolewinella aurantiaca]|uniref:Uncharacterized protein n=1 Tax=Neolewinella aurantiaca TaxID=2602767 RepID=A0A5C7FID0_9BACT|nr:hypothetical protein [Neolewinella aurantiaca]TXF90982.1 hypothetical protein FUA23_04050 [Neolewinella aurantiaca]
MSKASNINSLTELRERREAIKAEQEAARRGLTTTLAAAPAKAKEYALEDLALPALGIGLAAYVGYRVFRSNKSEATPYINEPTGPLLPVPLARPREEAQPAYTPPVRKQQVIRPVPEQKRTERFEKNGFNFLKLLTAGRLLIPAAQAIYSAVQKQTEQRRGADAGAEEA